MGRRRFANYQEFWPWYVAMHSRRLTRKLHYTGTLLGAAVALSGVVTGRPRLLAAWPALGYGFAWPAHWFVEKNNPATFGHVWWSLRGDFTMLGYFLRGRDAELSRIAEEWLARTPSREVQDWTAESYRHAA